MLPGKLSEFLGGVATIDPQVVVATAVYSDYIDMSKFEQVICVFQTGVTVAYAVQFSVYESTNTSAGSRQALIAATALTQSNGVVIINVRREQLSAGFRYLQMYALTNASQTGSCSAVALAWGSYQPTVNDDLTDVVEIKEA